MPHAIWTTGIGTGALRVPLNIGQPGFADFPEAVYDDLEIIIDSVESPLKELYENGAGWMGSGRCDEDVLVRADLPIPDDFGVGNDTSLENLCAAIRINDTNDWFETQPLTICTPGGAATCYDGAAQYAFISDNADAGLEGNGVTLSGAHGGSGMSVLFGTWRVSEMNGSEGGAPHPIKVLVPGSWMSTFDGGYRWPASTADGNYLSNYTGAVPACRMGALLTIPASFDWSALRTNRGRWFGYHLQNWGAYIVDQREDDPEVFTICIEHGPDQDMPGGGSGTGLDALNANYGDTMAADTSDSTVDDLGLDYRDLFAVMEVVNNNTESEIGGGGEPLIAGGGDDDGGGAAASSWALGGFVFDFADVPEDGGVEFGSAYRTSEYNPIGMQGSIITYYGTAGNKHELRVRLDEGQYGLLKAVCDAATMAGTTLTFYANRPLLVNGVEVVVREFSALWTKNVPGDIDNPGYWYEVRLLLQQTEFTGTEVLQA